MPTVTSATKHFPTAREGFTTTLASTIASGAVTVPLNSVAGFTNGATVVLVVEPTSATKKQAFTGVVDTAGVQITGVVWTEGTNDSHTAGVTVVDYETATHWALYSKGLLVEHNQDGTHSDITATTVTADEFIVTGSAGANNGWEVGLPTPDTITYNGNRSYDLVFNSNDLTDTLSNGMRTRFTRTVTPPTQCTDLESGSSQYWSKTSPAGTTFTDDFCAGAWVKLESYTGSRQVIVSRFNGTSGWRLGIDSSGVVTMAGFNAGGSNTSNVSSYQSIPLGKWVHVAAQLDMSAFTATTTTSYIMIDGVDVPVSVNRSGTNPTALVQAGNLEIGSNNSGTELFDGKLAQVWYSNAKITQANIKTFISQGMSGSETSIVSHYDFNGDGNDNNANANNLTANAGAGFTTDSPFNSTEYGIITANAFSTNTTLTVQVPEGYAIPTSGGVSAVAYSTQHTPYGFPSNKGKWRLSALWRNATATTSNATFGSYSSGGYALAAAIGPWYIGHRGNYYNATTTTVAFNLSPTSLSGLTITTGYDANPLQITTKASAAATYYNYVEVQAPVELTVATTYTLQTAGATTSAGIEGTTGLSEIFAEFNYI